MTLHEFTCEQCGWPGATDPDVPGRRYQTMRFVRDGRQLCASCGKKHDLRKRAAHRASPEWQARFGPGGSILHDPLVYGAESRLARALKTVGL